MNGRLTNQVTVLNVALILVQLPLVFIVWPVLNATSWLKWLIYYEVIVPMACKLAVLVENAAFRWSLYAIIVTVLYSTVVVYSRNWVF